MASLRKCKSCGNMVAKDAKRCPQCGGKVNKSHGCLLFIILIALVFIGISISGKKDNKQEITKRNTNENLIKLDNDKRKDGAVNFAKHFLKNECLPDGNFKIKFYDDIKVDYLKNITEIDKKLLESSREKGKTDIENWIVIKQDFSVADSPDVKLYYFAIVEFFSDGSYKMKSMSINGNQVFP